MSEKKHLEAEDPTGLDRGNVDPSVGSFVNDESTIPGGEVDPVYEKKAKVLNRAVSPSSMQRRGRAPLPLSSPY